MKENWRKNPKLLFASVFVLVVLFDQITKFIFSSGICNRGIAFGIGNISPLVPLLVLSFLIIMFAKERDYKILFGLNFIIAAGFSNFFDRLFMGCVRDFITVLQFPSFNLADAVITCGVLIIIARYSQLVFKKV